MALRDQLLQVVAWEDDSRNTLVYRFPMGERTAIMVGSKLTVRPSQVAIFVNRGQIADIFEPGEYKLETRNLPFLTAIGDVFFKGDKRFKAEVYFVNTKQFTGQKWGTANPIAMRDADFGMVRFRGFGMFGFKVDKPQKLLEELFGTNSTFTVEDISNHLKSHLISCMTDTIAESKISALDLAMKYMEFAEECKKRAQEKFKELGLMLTSFNIENLSFPEAVEKAIDQRTQLGIIGDKMGTYTQKAAADALGDAAKNPGTTGAFMGIGLGSNVGGVMGATLGNIANARNTAPAPQQGTSKFCPNCGTKISASTKFCGQCGTKQEANACPKCSAPIKSGSNFCNECGTKLT